VAIHQPKESDVRATFLTARPKALAVRTAALMALATSLICAGIAGGGAATAAAATAKLTITPTGYYNQCRVTVGGTVAGLYANGFDTSVRLWGSDEWDDDLLAGPFVNYWGPYDSGFGREFTLSCSTLNEDWGGARRDLRRPFACTTAAPAGRPSRP
jgi:hypothetical protein